MFDMRLFKRKGSPNWYVEYEKDRRISLKTSDEVKARAIFNEMESEALRGRLLLLDKRERVSISQFCDIYINDADRSELSQSTLGNDKLAFQRLIDVIGDKPLKLVSKDSIKKFKDTYLKRMAKTSINSYLGHIKAGLRWAKDEGFIEKIPPVKKYKLGNSLPRPIGKDDLKKILKYAKKHQPEMYRIINFALFTGCRRSEIVRARYEHISGDNITVKGKGQKERTFPLLPQALPERKDIGKIFRYQHKSTLSNYFRDKIVRKVGVNARFHDLRHTAGTMMLANGIDLPTVQKILGHSDIRTTQGYADVLQAHIAKEMDKMKGVSFE
jgi:integrase